MKKKPKAVGRPHAPITDYVTKISHFLVIGYSLKQSCQLGGVPYTTVVDYYRTNKSIRTKIDGFMASVGFKARANWVNAINSGDLKASWQWLVRFEPEDFGPRRVKEKDPSEREITVLFRNSPAR